LQPRATPCIRSRVVRKDRYSHGARNKEYRAKDLDVKTLPKGQMQILMTDDTRGVLHSRLHVRAPEEIGVPCFEPKLYPRLRHSLAKSHGANLRFTSPEIAERVHHPHPRRLKQSGAKP